MSPSPLVYVPQQSVTSVTTGPSWSERMWWKRREVIKLLFLSLTVLVAMSTHSVVVTYLNRWIEDASRRTVTPRVEAVVRIGYPVGVVLLLWVLKTVVR